MGKSRYGKTVAAGYSLDRGVVSTIEKIADDLKVSKSHLVNYILDRVIRSMDDADVVEDNQKVKKICATNKSIMHPTNTALTFDLCVHLEFVNELV